MKVYHVIVEVTMFEEDDEVLKGVTDDPVNLVHGALLDYHNDSGYGIISVPTDQEPKLIDEVKDD